MTKAESKRVQRFPRMKGITPRVRLTERLLHQTYNTLARARNSYLRGSLDRGKLSMYDIYKTKMGRRAPFNFLCLALDLVKAGIDPSLYVKVMSQYGKWANTRWLPHPTWLASSKALEIFDWKYKSEQRRYQLKSDWKRALLGNREEDILAQIGSSNNMVKVARSTFNMGRAECVLMLLQEVSPWYLATYLGAGYDHAEEIRAVIKADDELRDKVIRCLHYFRGNRTFWRAARKIFRRIS